MSAAETYAHDAEPSAGTPPLIVHVIRQFLPNRGGLEDVAANLARQTIDRGYRVRVVTLDSLFTAHDKKLPHREYISGIEVVAFRGRAARAIRSPRRFSGIWAMPTSSTFMPSISFTMHSPGAVFCTESRWW